MVLFFKLFKESFYFAYDALRQNKTRTFLSLLGITIGIVTIISVFALVDTFRGKLQESADKLGTKTVFIEKWPWGGFGEYPWWKYVQRPEAQLKEAELLKARLNDVEGVSYELHIANKTLKHKNNSIEGAKIIAVSYDSYKTWTFDFEEGRYFTELESQSGTALTVIGAGVAEGLFPNQQAVGKFIKIMGRNVMVVGVLKKEGEDMLGFSFDNEVVIPLNFARNLIDIRNNNYSPQITVRGKDNLNIDQLEDELRGAMRSIRKLKPAQEDDFALNKSTILSEQLDQMFIIINIAGWIIGGFSILVGGFGIANIMFVSVKERTNIIGIQKSLGAKNYFILMQFLFESIALSLIGGLLGLAIVFGASQLATHLFDFKIILNLDNIIRGITISVVIGVISGFWPAYSASALNPVDAIRSN
ncbi:ABC transporter permease [Pseudopedobacter beijingensis]|uniref:ABC transporter permease n=1 Tax=Pseudopedobacter beijingensis TaxID=1207056 RepID=A0ABW4IDD6_9SPHI